MKTANLDKIPKGSVRLDQIYKLYGPALVAVLKRAIEFLQEFIEGNACNEIKGEWICNQCKAKMQPNGEFTHYDDCEIVEAKEQQAEIRLLLTQLDQEAKG